MRRRAQQSGRISPCISGTCRTDLGGPCARTELMCTVPRIRCGRRRRYGGVGGHHRSRPRDPERRTKSRQRRNANQGRWSSPRDAEIASLSPRSLRCLLAEAFRLRVIVRGWSSSSQGAQCLERVVFDRAAQRALRRRLSAKPSDRRNSAISDPDARAARWRGSLLAGSPSRSRARRDIVRTRSACRDGGGASACPRGRASWDRSVVALGFRAKSAAHSESRVAAGSRIPNSERSCGR